MNQVDGFWMLIPIGLSLVLGALLWTALLARVQQRKR